MPRIYLVGPGEISSRIRLKWQRMKLIFYSFCYNAHCDLHYVVDTLMEPMFWFVDNYVRYFGPVFVGFLVSMMGLVILVAYFIVVPYEWVRTDSVRIAIYFTIGHYLLVNTLFHYYMAYTTPPGVPPQHRLLKHVTGICKHCIAPKPPRTHHCSICDRCILKMDHHCPWLNQCVGHNNHRYFFCTMFFMWLGCVYIVIGMYQCFSEHYWNYSSAVAPWCLSMNQTLFYAPMLCTINEIPVISEVANTTINVKLVAGLAAYNCIVFEFLTAAAMVVGMGALMCWHIRLISEGETSIEQHINKQTNAKFKKLNKIYVNPYDFGVKRNWLMFFGIDDPKRSFWTHVVFPSTHRPSSGDGLSFSTIYNNNNESTKASNSLSKHSKLSSLHIV